MSPIDSATEAWLGPRLEEAPAELAAAVRRLLEESATDVAARDPGLPGGIPGGIPGALAAAALRGFDGVVECRGADQASRTAALRLLAADAALTYAFEAASDVGADVLHLAARAGVDGALGQRLHALSVDARPASTRPEPAGGGPAS